MQEKSSKILKDLNKEQIKAVTAPYGPVLVIAGAGSGKTRVLTYRIAYLLENGVSPYSILAVTFTNKAAGEMKDRLSTLLGDIFYDMWVGTFHSTALKILKIDGKYLGISKDFLVFDETDSLGLVKRAVGLLELDPKRYAPKVIKSRIDDLKMKGIGPEEFIDSARFFYDKKVGEVYKRYEMLLFESNALDFAGLLMNAVKLFKEFPEILSRWQDRFRFILVDEYQDINDMQYRFVKYLSNKHKNIFVVGDPDQSIYSFRGANIKNILNFERDFPDAQVIKLKNNYRSTQTIIEASKFLIRNNRGRIDKELVSVGQKGDPIMLFQARDAQDEAEFVAEEIENLIKDRDFSNKDFAVLYRTNSQSRAFEEAFLRRGIPFKIIGGVGFYRRKEIKDVLSYLRFIANPKDAISLQRITNITDKTFTRILPHVEKLGETKDYEGVIDTISGIARVTKNKLINIYKLREKILPHIEDKRVFPIVDMVLRESGYLELLKKDDMYETRLENIQEFLRACKDFDKKEQGDLYLFLEEISLYTDLDVSSPNEDVVPIMTFHSSKGLEFRVVFIVGVEEGLIPHSRSIESLEDIEEERRLFYVAMTRAQELLYMTYAFRRNIYGNTLFTQRSRFLDEVPKRFVKNITERDKSFIERPTIRKAPSGSSYEFESGDRVLHQKWGKGIIINKISAGSKVLLEIDFGENGIKRLIPNYAPLQKLGE